MGQRVGDGALKQLLGRATESRVRRQEIVETLEACEETLDFGFPRLRGSGLPDMLSLGHPQSPVEQVADVREDLQRRARRVAHASRSKPFGRRGDCLATAVGKGGDGVTKELTFYLVEKGEKDPWRYAIYHCGTASNIYSQVHWGYFPIGAE